MANAAATPDISAACRRRCRLRAPPRHDCPPRPPRGERPWTRSRSSPPPPVAALPQPAADHAGTSLPDVATEPPPPAAARRRRPAARGRRDRPPRRTGLTAVATGAPCRRHRCRPAVAGPAKLPSRRRPPTAPPFFGGASGPRPVRRLGFNSQWPPPLPPRLSHSPFSTSRRCLLRSHGHRHHKRHRIGRDQSRCQRAGGGGGVLPPAAWGALRGIGSGRWGLFRPPTCSGGIYGRSGIRQQIILQETHGYTSRTMRTWL